jgi:putative aldouronate transport system permease protein
MNNAIIPNKPPLTKRKRGFNNFPNFELYLFLLPAFLYFVIFHYAPIYGLQIAFKDFNPAKGIMGSPFVGFDNFRQFFESYHFFRLIRNTLGISLYSLALGFPIPIILSLMLNEVKGNRFKKAVQMVTYAPHFISVVVLVGMLAAFLKTPNGLINQFRTLFGMDPVAFLSEEGLFQTVYVLSGIWQNAGWGTVIYLAALSGIDPELHEAALIDGATRLQRIVHINLPGILPMIIILLILNAGRIMSVGFEQVYLMQNPLNLGSSEVISTYVYKSGLQDFRLSFASAVGLFNSAVNFLVLVIVNTIAAKSGESSLW